MSVKSRLILLTLLPILIVAFSIGITSVLLSYDSTQSNMEEASGNLQVAYGDMIESTLQGLGERVEAMARVEEFYDDTLSDEQKTQALVYEAGNTGINNIGIFGADGLNIFIGYADGTTVPVGVADISSRSYLPEALSGKTVIFGPSKDVVTGDITITVATPIDVPGAPEGIVAVDFRLDELDQIIKDVSFGKSGYAYLMDSTGMIIAHPDNALVGLTGEELLAYDPALGEAVAAMETMLQTGEGSLTYDYNGEKYTTYAPIEGTDGWELVMVANTDDYFDQFQQALMFQLIITGVLVVVFIFVALHFGRKISRPIEYAAKHVEGLSQGRLELVQYKVKDSGKDEVSKLILSLSSAVSTLHTYVEDISGKLGEMAHGNLNIEVTTEYLGDFAPIKASMTQIIDSLNNMMQEIDKSSDQVAAGASQVSMSSQSLAQGTTEQAASVTQVASTMARNQKEMTETSRSAETALEMTQQSHGELANSKQLMDDMLSAMSEISEASDSISKILKTIDSIAFQTNILALNAAVEAARAGQHGSGFAVVADEVRNLAAKSAEAAKETGELIQRSEQAVEKGIEIANKTAAGLDRTAAKSQEVEDIIAQMAQTIGRQAEAFTGLNTSIEQISEVTQTYSATSQESAAASEELSAQSDVLKSLVSRLSLRAARIKEARSDLDMQGYGEGFDMDDSKY